MQQQKSLTERRTDKAEGKEIKNQSGGRESGVQREGAEEEREAQWWANCSAVTQARAYVEFNIKKHTLAENHKKS